MFEIMLDKIVYVIICVCEYDSGVNVWVYIGQCMGYGIQIEFVEFIVVLNDDEKVSFVVVMWIGCDIYVVDELFEVIWIVKVESCLFIEIYLMGELQFVDYFEVGLEVFGILFEDVEDDL